MSSRVAWSSARQIIISASPPRALTPREDSPLTPLPSVHTSMSPLSSLPSIHSHLSSLSPPPPSLAPSVTESLEGPAKRLVLSQFMGNEDSGHQSPPLVPMDIDSLPGLVPITTGNTICPLFDFKGVCMNTCLAEVSRDEELGDFTYPRCWMDNPLTRSEPYKPFSKDTDTLVILSRPFVSRSCIPDINPDNFCILTFCLAGFDDSIDLSNLIYLHLKCYFSGTSISQIQHFSIEINLATTYGFNALKHDIKALVPQLGMFK
ncbi:hypothetical protein P691DRAFT_768203 [Macrolepiota fuliginosa MF-IS2]|uniref:Uncharacterized protein n=1 Tax=Macrolepiota fuliginosa MF-IS2 TaxID=1400762 RepID=A0A9P5WXA5_9AGAR|nr:hypothetical protein P691DRAFT_768203 [Macrolepiota fuliginosa MF-IS2]